MKNKTVLKILLLLPVIFAITVSESYAQMTLVNEPDKPSVQASEMTKYGKLNAQLYTGRVSISVPVYTYRDSRFTLPISLDYSYNGLVANRQAGIVGLGWSLTCAGAITREVRGIPDELTGNFHFPSNTGFELRDLYGFDGIPSGSDPQSFTYEGIQQPSPSNVLKTAYEIAPKLYETTSDIYHFSFPGHSGSFYRNVDGSFTVFHTSSFDGNYRIEKQNIPANDYEGNVSSLFTITTSDGYRYTFGGVDTYHNADLFTFIERSVPRGYDKGSPEDTPQPYRAISFLLRQIDSPDGSSVLFNYNEKSGHSDIITYSPSFWVFSQDGEAPANTLYVSEELNTCSYLTSIEVDGKRTVEFFYENKPSGKQGTYLQAAGYDQARQVNINASHTYLMLDSISTPAGGTKLSYIYSSLGNPYPFLDSIHQDGLGCYRFGYEGTQDRYFPALGTVATDHWGYLNRADSSQMNRNSISLSSLATLDDNSFDETPSSSRAANTNASSIGLMRRITYPTGGSSLLEYEDNTVWRNLRKMRDNLFVPIMYTSSAGQLDKGPGSRIARIINIDREGNPTDTTRYVYNRSASGYATSGSLLVYPRYRLRYAGLVYSTNFLVNVSLASFSGIAGYEATPVEYSRVEEIHPDRSRTVHYFTGWDECPDGFSVSAGELYHKFTNASGLPAYGVFQIRGRTLTANGEVAVHNILCPPVSFQHRRGREMQTEFYSKEGTLLRRTENTFEMDEAKPAFMEPVYIGEAMTFLLRNTADTRVTQTSATDYLTGGRHISSTGSYIYNSLGQRNTETKTLSNGDILTTSYTFIQDISRDKRSNIQTEMFRKGRIASPVKATVKVRTHGTAQERFISCDSLTFKAIPAPSTQDTLYLPAKWSKQDVETGQWNIYATYLYDGKGDMVQRKDADSVSTAFVWHSDNTGVALRVDNATAAEVNAVLINGGYTTFSSDTPQQTMETAAQALRSALPKSAVSWYLWHAYGLPKKVCDPSGRVTHYTYDAAQRLNVISDDSLNPVERYDYQTLTR